MRKICYVFLFFDGSVLLKISAEKKTIVVPTIPVRSVEI
jgi:hypothetical protein